MFYRGKKRVKKDADVFQKSFAGFFEQIRGSGMLLAVLLVGVLVVMAAVWVASSRRIRDEGVAQAKLAAAFEQPNSGERLEAFRKLAEEASGSQAGAVALWTEAALLHEAALKGSREENLKRSLAQLDKSLAQYPQHALVPRVMERRAMVLEDLGNYPEAAEAFEQAAKKVANTDFAYLRGKLLYGQARCQEQLKQREQAVQTLEQALKSDAEDRGEPWRPAASALLAQLRPATTDLRIKDAAPDAPPVAAPPATEGPKTPEKPSPKKGG